MKIVKRDGAVVEYNGGKIFNAIVPAMIEVGIDSLDINEDLINDIEREVKAEIILLEELHGRYVTVEMISDITEDRLMAYGLHDVAKRFIIYREERSKERDKKWKMTDLQYDIWSQKYEYNDEGFEGFLNRVSSGNNDIKKLIRQKKFLFGGRILASRGLQHKGRKITFSNCYVAKSPEDNLESIFKTASDIARTFSYGGGEGINIGKLRPNGAKVNNSAETTTGATSFMSLFSKVTEIIGQRGRRGALMISIPSRHPDLELFINIKKDMESVTKANISIMFDDAFFEAVENNEQYELKFIVEDTGEIIQKEINAKDLLYKFAESNWDNAEPGALYWSKIESYNLLSEDKEFEFASVNPCAKPLAQVKNWDVSVKA